MGAVRRPEIDATSRNRRDFLIQSGKLLMGASAVRLGLQPDSESSASAKQRDDAVKLFLTGDVMTGRGVDQILPRSVDPRLHESYIKNAEAYVELAERANGPVPEEVTYDYIWGDALDELERASPDLRIVNLETSVTTSDDYWKGKAVHYRMHPQNTPCLTAAGIDCCVLANNHVLDWGYEGLQETLRTLELAGIKTTGAGNDLEEAERPAIFEMTDRGRVLVFAMGSWSSGIPAAWAAADDRPGVHLIDESSPGVDARIRAVIDRYSEPDDLVVVSIHWGPNWGYEIPTHHRRLARQLIDGAGVDVVHGHSSHHVKGIEVYQNRPILYGCGDLLTDYEGISGHEDFRGDLGLMYFVSLEEGAQQLVDMEMTPTQMERLQLKLAPAAATEWLVEMLNREGSGLGTTVEVEEHGRLRLRHD